jgi:hypothetical protein
MNHYDKDGNIVIDDPAQIAQMLKDLSEMEGGIPTYIINTDGYSVTAEGPKYIYSKYNYEYYEAAMRNYWLAQNGMYLFRVKAIIAPVHTDAFDGFLGKLRHFFLGPNVGDFRYDKHGNYQGPALNAGIAPSAGSARAKIIQYGTHTLRDATLKALKITKEEGEMGIEAMKRANQLPPDFHGNIGIDGSYWSKAGEYIDNILEYIK